MISYCFGGPSPLEPFLDPSLVLTNTNLNNTVPLDFCIPQSCLPRSIVHYANGFVFSGFLGRLIFWQQPLASSSSPTTLLYYIMNRFFAYLAIAAICVYQVRTDSYRQPLAEERMVELRGWTGWGDQGEGTGGLDFLCAPVQSSG